MAETRTGPLVKKLVEGLQEDMEEAVRKLKEGRAVLSALEGETKGVNGLAAFLKAKVNALDQMVADMEEESEDVEKKLIGAGREIVQSVDIEKAEAVKAARAVS